MKKSPVAAAVALSLGAAAAQAAQVTVTQMLFYTANGASSTGQGGLNTTIGNPTISAVGDTFNSGTTDFFGDPWTANVAATFSEHSTTFTWETSNLNGGTVTIPAVGTFPTFFTSTFDFHLTDNQVAFGLLFTWGDIANIPVLAVFNCADGTNSTPVDVGDGATPTTGNGTPGTAMQVQFPGQTASFSGLGATVPFSGAVPVPAAAWLFGSGLLGLVGVARRGRNRKSA